MPPSPIRRIAVCTGGGDAPGLNAVIRAVTIAAIRRGWECLGIRDGFNGILFPERYPAGGVVRLTRDTVRGIAHQGGTILGTTNKGDPFHCPTRLPDGTLGEVDRSNGRRPKAYELTPAGERALHDWLTSEDPLHIELRHEGALKFFFSDGLTREEQLAQLRHTRRTHERIAEELRAIEPEPPEGKPPAPLMTLEFGIAYQEFLAGWCAEAERRLAGEPATRR